MQYHFERSLYKLPMVLLCCMGLLVGASGVSFANSRATPVKQANFTLLPYNPSYAVKKTYFDIASSPGKTVQQELRVTNAGNVVGTARLTPVDATTGPSGGVVYLSPSQKQHAVGPWITIGTPQVTIVPGQSVIVQFHITVPKDALAGEHVGGIVAQNMALQHSSNGNGNGNFQVTIQRLTIVPVEMTLPGAPTELLATKGVQVGGYGSKQTMNISLQNTGNVMIKPHGTLEVTDTSGTILQKLVISMDTFLPQTSVSYPAYVQGKALGAGNYQASLILYYGNAHILRYTTTFTVSQQQIAQTFGTPPGLQTPWGSTTLPLWVIILIAVSVIIVFSAIGHRIYALFHKKPSAASHPNRRAGDPGQRAAAPGWQVGDPDRRASNADRRAGDASQRAGNADQRVGDSSQRTDNTDQRARRR